MKLTLITATYNSARTLEGAMQSVLQQGYPDLEYILVDGGSGDGTVALVERYAAQYPCIRWVSEPDHGIYDALNKGVAMATGEAVGFVHSDDFLARPGILVAVADAFRERETDGVYGDLHYIDAQNEDHIVRNWKSRAFHASLLRKGWMPAHPTFFLKKSVYEKHGGFDLSFRIAADYDFMLRVLGDESLSFSYLPEVITKMRVGGMSNRSLKNILQKSREDYRAIKKNGLPFPAKVLLAKNLSKIPQFLH
jgi:glycosyltransferase